MVKAAAGVQNKFADVHTRLMKKNYEEVPQYWFHIILVLMVALAIFACEGFNHQLQLPWWGVLLACLLAFSFTLPVGIIQATTNNVISNCLKMGSRSPNDLGLISSYVCHPDLT